jgi:hypothetical protein
MIRMKLILMISMIKARFLSRRRSKLLRPILGAGGTDRVESSKSSMLALIRSQHVRPGDHFHDFICIGLALAPRADNAASA